MIKCNLSELMGKEKIRSISNLSRETGISRVTLHELYHDKNKAIRFETIETLCRYFNCEVGDLLEYEKEGE